MKGGREPSRRVAVSLAAALSSVLVAGCAGTPFEAVGEGFKTAGERIQGAFWEMEMGMRSPGDKLLARPEAVWAEYACADKPLPFLKLEENEVLPPRTTAGKEVNHRLVYGMCPKMPSEVVRGDLSRRIYYRGQVVFEDVATSFEVKPGKWSVDAFITIPREAEAGVYSLDTSFSGDRLSFKGSRSLIIAK